MSRRSLGQQAELDTGRQLPPIAARPSRIASPAIWWYRDFPGATDQVREARHWVEDLLPECDPLQEILLLASELCANAVLHTRSGAVDGRFSVHVEWSSELARVVIEDQGSPTVPAVGEKTWTEEFGRGLWLVNEMASDWGTGCHPAGRVTWADVQWQAKGGPLLRPPGGTDLTLASIAALRAAFPGTTIWWGHQTEAWWAAVPVAKETSGLISSPTIRGLSKVLATDYPKLRRDPGGCSLPPTSRQETLAALASKQPEN